MADIFDQVASGSGDSVGGSDIFDQVAQQQNAADKDASNVAVRDLGKSLFQQGVTASRASAPPSALPTQTRYQRLQSGQKTSLQSESSDAAGMGEMNPRDVIRASAQPKYNPPPAPTLSAPQTAQAANAEQQSEHPMRPIPLRNFALSDEDLATIGGMQATPQQQEQIDAQRDRNVSGLPLRERVAEGIATGSGFAAGPRQDVGEIGSGVEELGEANRDRDANKLAKGGTDILEGAMGLGTPLFAAGVAAAPVRAGLYYLAGVGAGKVASAAAKAAGLTPDEQEFWNTAGFFLPNALTGLAGIKGVRADLGDRGKIAGVQAFGGRVGAGIYRGPEGAGGGVKVGGRELTFKMGRAADEPEQPNAPPTLPDPAQVLARDQSQAAASAVGQANALDQAAKNVSEGKPPVPPAPKPPMPQGMDQGTLRPEVVQNLASAISSAPPETRPQLVMEAHQHLAEWIATHGKVMGPDGKIAIAKTPEQAQQIAAKWVNDEVARQDVIRNQEKAKTSAQQKTEKNETANQRSQQPPTLQQRAQTIIEANEDATPDTLAKTLVKQLGIGYADGKKMVQDARAGKSANIETSGTAVDPEAKKAVDDQVADLKAGRVKAVRLPQGSTYVPALPEGIKRVDARQGAGAGTYLYDPEQVKAATIRAAAKAGTHDDLLAPTEDVFDQVAPESLAEKGVDATMGAAAKASPEMAARPIEQQRAAAEKDIAAQKDQISLLVKTMGPDAAKAYSDEVPEARDIARSIFPEAFASEGGSDERTEHSGSSREVPAPEPRGATRSASDNAGVRSDREGSEAQPPLHAGSTEPGTAAGQRENRLAESDEPKNQTIKEPHREGEDSLRSAEEGSSGPAPTRSGAGVETAAAAERPGQPAGQMAPEQAQPIEHTYEAEVSRHAGDPDARMERIQAENRRHAESLLAAKFPGERIGSAGRVTEVPAETMPENSERKEVAENRQSQNAGAGQPEQGVGALEKGAHVSFTDRSGNEHTGTIAHADERIARIKADDNKKSYTVAIGRIKPLVAGVEQEDNDTHGAGEAHPAGLDQAGGGRPAAGAGGENRERLEEVPRQVLPGTGEGGNAEEGNPSNSPDVRGNAASVPEPRIESGPGSGSDTGLDRTPAAPVAEKATKRIAKPKALNRGWYAHPDAWKPPTGTVGRLDANLSAIRILRDVEKNPRKLTEEERDALANYVGWGALPNVFAPYLAPRDEQPRWRKANEELTSLLSPDELARAQESTKNAHYTSPELVRFMWDTMARFGFKAGNVLEPAVGTGNFLGMMPKSLRSKINAIVNEMDSVSYGIMRLLYPEATAFNKDFADLILPDNDVDVAIGNPPFGGYKLYDPAYKKLNALVHDFFFVKSLDKVRPGGVLAFITSTGTMDKQDANIRNILASKADFLGAIRLPSGAFKANAGTDVTTDLIFLQKRAPGQEPKHVADWLAASPMNLPTKYNSMEPIHVNEYFQKHPEMMLGRPTASTKMYGGMGFLLEPSADGNIVDQLKDAQKKLPRGIISDAVIQQATGDSLAQTAAEFAPDNIKENQFTINEKGQLKQRINGKLVNPEAALDKAGKPVLSKIQRIKALVGVRDSMNRLLASMITQSDDEDGNALVAEQRDVLAREYDRFQKKYGYLNSVANGVFRDDPHYPRLLALETWDKAARAGTPADIFRRRTIFPRQELSTLPDDPKAALQLILAERGFPDVQMMARLRGEPVDAIVKTLRGQGLIYRNPASGSYETRETYLSGYVRDKLRDAKKAVKQGMTEYEPNVAALEKVVPADIEIGPDPATSVSVRLGSTWIPTEAIQDFIRDEFNSPGAVKYTLGNWSVDGVHASAEAVGLYSTPRADADWLLQQTLNQKQAMIYDVAPDGTRTLNSDATTAAQAAQEKIRRGFSAWAVKSDWKPELQRLYNDAYNNLAQVEYDGSHLTFPGMNPSISLRSHQVNAIWRILQDGRALLAHEVGAGKTFEMAAAIMEGRRVGTFKKPMLTVPNHIVEQFRQEFLHLYPGANLLVPTEQDFDAKNRQRIMSRIATGDFDAIILPHSQFNLMDISPARQRVTIQAQKEELRQTIESLKSQNGEKRTVKQLETAMAKLDASLKKLADLKADRAIYFDDTGVDALFVDEAHLYKNLSFYTKMTRIAGLQQAKAKSALRLKMKTEYLQDRNRGRGVIFATGTPIQNTMAELYTMMKYVAPDVLEKAGIRFFDDWAANFGSVITAMELSADGRSYKARSKFAQFQNVPELMNMFRSFADIKTAQDLDLPKPELETGRPIVVPVPGSELLEDYVGDLMKRAEAVKSGAVDPREDNMLKITTDGRKAATDMRLINPELKDEPDSKINTAIEKIYQEWVDGKDALPEGPTTQMAFLDLYRSIAKTDSGDEKELINLYSDMRKKLVDLGVPKAQIAVIGEHDTRIKRQKLFDAMNRGEVRILFGSTQKMGAGTNAQRLMRALHHIDLTWRPGDLAQRNGRIERQGNLNPSVREYSYLTERSFDAYMAQTLQGKAEFIAQIMSGRSNQRVMSDVASEMVLSLEEMKIAASGNPDVKLQYDLQMQKSQLEALERSFGSQRRMSEQESWTANQRADRYQAEIEALTKAESKIRAIEGTGEEKGIKIEVDGRTFTSRKALTDHLDSMDVPPGNFYMTWNGIGIEVDVKPQTDLMKKSNLSGVSYRFDYESHPYQAPRREMFSLARSIESRLRQIPDDLEAAKVQLPKLREKATRLAEIAENAEFPEARKLAEITEQLHEVERRLGLRSDVENAMAQAVSAEVADDPEDDELAEAPEPDGTDVDQLPENPGPDITAAQSKATETDGAGPGRTEGGGITYLHGGIGAVIPLDAMERAAKPVLEAIGLPQEYEKVRTSRDLQDSLYTLESQANAAVIRMKRLMDEVPGTPSDQEAIYHYLEDPSLPLTRTQEQMLDEYIAPLMEGAREKAEAIQGQSIPVENYVHRIVKGKSGEASFLSRLMAGSKSTGRGNLLNRSKTSSQKNRSMMALEAPDGERHVVSISGNRVTAFHADQEPEDMGKLSSGLTTRWEMLDERLEPIARDIIETKDKIAAIPKEDREEYLENLQAKIDRMKRDRDLVGKIKGRVPGQRSAHGVEVSFNKRASLSRQIDAAEKELEAYQGGTAEPQLSNRAKGKLQRLNAKLEALDARRAHALDEVPTDQMAQKVWVDKDGKTWRITQATTKEIEANTNLEYYHNALASAVLNWLAVDRQYRAMEFLKNFTENPQFARIGMKVEEGKQPPKDWRTTELPQLRGYYFEPHTAEVLDWYHDRLKARQPGIFSKINNFLVTSIFFNPLLHVPNILNHWVVEKGASGWLDPRLKPSQARAAVKAINAVMHQNDDFLAALDAGAPLQSQQYETHQYANILLEKIQGEIESNPSAWGKMATYLGYANPLKLLDAMKNVSGHITWYSNDIAFLQSAYEKTARGMDLKTALRETGKHIPDYRLPTRILDSAGLAKTLSNRNLVMFMHYHYGALRSYGEMLKSLAGVGFEEAGTEENGEATNAAGRTRDRESLHALDVLAMLGLVTLVVYPEIDKLIRRMTGDQNATTRRAGASTVPYNLIQMMRGEKSPADALQASITPGVGAKLAFELATNRDIHTGRHIYNYPIPNWETFGEQTGGRLMQSFGPADQITRSNRDGLEHSALGMVGISFPEHGAMKVADEIAETKSDREALSPEQWRQMGLRYAALEALRAGNNTEAYKLMDQAHITRRQRHILFHESGEDPLVEKVKHFSADEVQRVYDHATAAERLKLGPMLRKKRAMEARRDTSNQ